MPQCSSCGADIIWAETSGGKRMPLDAKPNELGNIELDRAMIRFVARDRNATTPRYVSHFATCPHASKHRNAAKRERKGRV